MRFQMNPKKIFFFNYRNVKQYISEEQVYTKKQKEPNKNQQNRKYYKERVEMVEEINLIEIKKLIEQLESIGEIKPGEIFLGDIHTHPILPSELSGISGAQPSDGDIKEIIDAYENNILNFREPFIFSIAAPDEKGETMYAFYRLVKTKEGYKPKHLDH